MVPYKTIRMINEIEFSEFVSKHYGRPYRYQQQDGCKSNGIEHWKIPIKKYDLDSYFNDTIEEVINGVDRGVSLKAWLERDPKASVGGDSTDYIIKIFWERSFYPHITSIFYDLYRKGLIEEGEYYLNIDID